MGVAPAYPGKKCPSDCLLSHNINHPREIPFLANSCFVCVVLLVKRLKLQEARVAGCRTAAEAERYIKNRESLGENSQRMNDEEEDGGIRRDKWDVSGFIGADILSEAVRGIVVRFNEK